MALNRGKQFENKFKTDFEKIPNATIDRLPDVMSGYKAISGISDFIGYCYPLHFYIECKSINGNTFPVSNFTQYKKMLCKVGIHGVRAGVVIWFVSHKKVIYVPCSTFTKLLKDGKKSFNIRTMLNNQEYFHIEIPSTVKRVFLDSDYSVLMNTVDGQ